MNNRRTIRTTSATGSRSWPLILLLVAVVLVPTLCVLWFMHEVTQNEHLAVRKRLTDLYRSHLPLVRERLENQIRAKLAAADRFSPDVPGAEVFHDCIRARLADSVICYDASGNRIYPPARSAAPTQVPAPADRRWIEANHLEYVQRDFAAAAESYAAVQKNAVAQEPPNLPVAARALLSQARCLVPDGQTEAALRILTEELASNLFEDATDPQGRLIVVAAELRALELMGGPAHQDFQPTLARLSVRLNDYENRRLDPAQRVFAMNRVQDLAPQQDRFPTLAAEELAARFVSTQSTAPREPVVRPSGLDDVWQIASPQGKVLLLFQSSRIVSQMCEWADTHKLPPEVTLDLIPPSAPRSNDNVIATSSAGALLPEWQLTLSPNSPDFFQSATSRQITVYLWIGILVIATTFCLAIVVARAIRRQVQLARLKNDLVATITHELKTPLASMRLLVDTLLDTAQPDADQTREYLQLIGKENTRLCRLIDNFLAFSRIERNKYAFDFVTTSISDVVDDATDSVQERFQSPDCRFDVQVEPNLPPVLGDTDALVTVVLNLLDNAYKYTPASKHIVLRVFRHDDEVCIEVQDNGIGLSARDAKRVFRRFYQVDQRLSRVGGGCGLGLSIVQYIVDAHRGRVEVTSRPHEGSRFLVTLPAAPVDARVTEGTAV